jgi:hypothetical protein
LADASEEQRGLAGTVGPEQADDLAWLHGNADPVKHVDVPVASADVDDLEAVHSDVLEM